MPPKLARMVFCKTFRISPREYTLTEPIDIAEFTYMEARLQSRLRQLQANAEIRQTSPGMEIHEIPEDEEEEPAPIAE